MKKQLIKKYRITILLLITTILLVFITVMLPSKNIIKDSQIRRTNEDKNKGMKVVSYTINTETDSLKKYELKLKEDILEKVLKNTLNDSLKKYYKNEDYKVEKIYFGDQLIYLKFNTSSIDEKIFEALVRTTKEMFDIKEVKKF